MKPSERIKQLATDIRNTDMLGVRLPSKFRQADPKKEDYIEAIIQFLDEALAVGKFGSGVPVSKWSWDKDLANFETLAINLRNDGQTSRAEAVEYLIARCRRAEAKK